MSDRPGGANPLPERVVRAVISGRVQGVGYRAWTQTEAEALGLRGWVRNRTNGDVEAALAGPAAGVEALCRLLWRGPPAAEVDRVTVTEAGERDLAMIGGARGVRQIATI
ncbi:MAG: acylphosphatase [Methylocella sp.]